MRVGLVHPRLDRRGGAENVVLWMARGMIERGFEVVVATDRFSPERWGAADWDGVPLFVANLGWWDGLKPRAVRKRGVGRRLREAIAGCGLVVAHNAPAPLWATTAARAVPGARVVWYCEEPKARIHWRTTMPTVAAALERIEGYPWAAEPFASVQRRAERYAASRRCAVDRRLELEALRDVELVLANSEFTAKNAERVFGRTVTPCLLGAPIPAPVASHHGEAYVAWIASAVPHKNAHGFLEAVRIAARELGATDLRLRVVGLDPERFGPLAEAAGIANAIGFEEWVSDSELNEIVAGCRFLAYPTIDEPFGLMPLHAMAHGRAVLTSKGGGPSEIVVDGVTGVHADPMDPRDMAVRLVELWRDPARCDALGAAGRDRYYAHFTFDRFLDRFEKIVFGAASTRVTTTALAEPSGAEGGNAA